MEQKFKKGNRVKVLVGNVIWENNNGKLIPIDISPNDVGRIALIDYSYAEKYGGDNVNSYSIVWEDDGSSLAWKDVNELEFIEEGGCHLLEKAARLREKISKQNTDFNHIINIIDNDEISSETILFLFKKIGFKSSFYSTGEFFNLFSEWELWHPIFKHVKNSSTLEEAKSLLTDEGNKMYNLELLFNEFKKAQGKNI